MSSSYLRYSTGFDPLPAEPEADGDDMTDTPLPPPPAPADPPAPTPAPAPEKKGHKLLYSFLACIGGFVLIVVVAAVAGGGKKGPTTPDNPIPTVTYASAEPPTTAAGAPPTTAAPATPKYGDGTMTVGKDIPPGRYRGNLGSSSCYWTRLSNFTGDITSGTIASDLAAGPAIVDIAPTDVGFKSQRCGEWTPVESGPAPKTDGVPLANGTFLVGTDVQPGTYKASGGGTCYWVRLKDFSGDITTGTIASDLGTNPVVTIAPTDVGFKSQRCGTWTRIS